jgi:hypothetical protein
MNYLQLSLTCQVLLSGPHITPLCTVSLTATTKRHFIAFYLAFNDNNVMWRLFLYRSTIQLFPHHKMSFYEQQQQQQQQQ